MGGQGSRDSPVWGCVIGATGCMTTFSYSSSGIIGGFFVSVISGIDIPGLGYFVNSIRSPSLVDTII